MIFQNENEKVKTEDVQFDIIESQDAKDFIEKVNQFKDKHTVLEVTTTSTSFTSKLTKFIAHIWHSGPRATA